MDLGFKVIFKKQIQEFCSKNKITIHSVKSMGRYDNYSIECDTDLIKKLEQYANSLENNLKVN